MNHAFLWNGTLHDLGTLGGPFSLGADINRDGWIIGTSSVAGDAENHAFLWDGNTMTDLNSYWPAGSPYFLEAALVSTLAASCWCTGVTA